MNRERIIALADHIETLEHTKKESYSDDDKVEGGMEGKFRMKTYLFSCGAPACIAGHACAMFCPQEDNWMMESFQLAKTVLWLSTGEATTLFIPNEVNLGDSLFGDITPKMATATLRHFAETGEVVWNFS